MSLYGRIRSRLRKPREPDPFEVYDAARASLASARFLAALAAAKDQAQTNGDRRFVESCRRWYRKNGILTEPQLTALKNVGQYADFADMDAEELWDHFGLCEADFAGGPPW